MARLSLLLPNLESGGAERVALSLAEECLAHGHEVDMVLVDAKGALLDLLPPGVRLFDLKAKRLRNALLPMVRYLRERRPAAIQASMWPLTITAILAARFTRSRPRVVVSDHSILSQQYGHSKRTLASLKATTRLFYPLASARVCVSEGSAAELARLSGLPRGRFEVIPNPVLRPPAKLTATPEVERMWADATRRILTVGTLKDAKDHLLLIRALELMKADETSKLLIVGDGPLRQPLKRLIETAGLTGKVVLAGATLDPWPFYASADLFVLSSQREGFPGVLMEALVAGLPVVSTDCGSGPRQILDDGRLGRLVAVGDAEAMAEAMSMALAEKHDPVPGRAHALRLSQGSGERYLELMLGRACR